ncbi:MAG: enoyl-CoA hydratase/isomerase family protein [Acidobacteria bacterium]|nr:enoyl-CoA hydratase/isomerase family protein [Acidobacteriota bacterium]
MSDSSTLFELDGPVARLTFNRPEARNALTWGMYEALVEACDRVDRSSDVRVFILRGAGGDAFAAGTDIRQFIEFQDGEDGIRYEKRIDSVLERLEQVTIPTIAQVHGVAAGAGCAIAFSCDLRICTPDASFGIPIAGTLGNCLSAASCARLSTILGSARLKAMLFTGRFINATDALAKGLVTQLAPGAVIEETVRDYAAAIVANAPLTIRASKEILRRLQAHQPQTVEDADQIRLCYGSDDFREGIAAFLDKRPPRWTGN